MSKKIVKKENRKATWEEVRDTYKSTVSVYLTASSYLKNFYNKYKKIIDKNPATKKVIDGAANTLIGYRKMLDGLALGHIEKATEEDVKNNVETFKGPNGELFKFKTGPIDEDNDKDVEIAIKTLISYGNITNNIYTLLRNTISVLLKDLENIINNIKDEKEREEFIKMLEADKEEMKEGDNNGRNEKK